MLLSSISKEDKDRKEVENQGRLKKQPASYEVRQYHKRGALKMLLAKIK